MQPTSDRFQVACKESGKRIVVADLYYNRNRTPIVTDLPVVDGTLTYTMSDIVRRSGSITLAATDLISLDSTHTLEPYGLEIGIRMGVEYPDGTQEFIPMGVYVIINLEMSEDTGGLPVLEIVDRSRWISEQSSKTGIEDYSGKMTFDSIRDLLTKSVFIDVFITNDYQDPLLLLPDQLALVVDNANLTDIKIPGASPMEGGSFWDNIQQLAASLGAECFFNNDGSNVVLRKIPDITSDYTDADVDLEVTIGEQGTLLTCDRTLSRDGAYNAVQLTGALAANAADTATPPTVFIYDNDPSSVTFYDITGGTNGPFGRIVHAETMDTITDKTALTAAATALLKKGLGLTKAMSYTMLLNPSTDVGDIHKVYHLDGTTDLCMVTEIGYSLIEGSMSISTICPNQITAFIGGDGSNPGLGGGTVPPPPSGSITKSYNATWSQSYTAGGSKTSGSAQSHCYQGDDNLGDGNRKSLIGFNYTTIQSDLAGKTIDSCSLKLHYEHWYYGAGGTAIIGTHNSTSSPPSSYPSTSTNRVHSASWPNPGTKTVNLGTAIGGEFRDGTTKGIALGPGPSTSRTYYGYASGFGTSIPPVLTITYH